MICERFKALGEYGAAGLYEQCDRSLFYRKALGLKRYYENCELYAYHGERLYPSGRRTRDMCISPHYMNGFGLDYDRLCAKDAELADIYLSDFDRYHSSVPPEHTVAGNMYTHSMPHYERVLSEGLLSYRERIARIEDVEIRDGLLLLLEGLQSYVRRCVDYLISVGADEKLISALKCVPMQPARTLYEALVAWNFVLYLDNCDNMGCLAAGLQPYYNGEDITDLLRQLYDNLDVNDGYSMSLQADDTPLTMQCLEASKGKRRPMIELFIRDDAPNAVWNKAFEVLRTGNGQPAFYSHQLLQGLQRRFPILSDEDIRHFCGGGCAESMVAGLSNVGSLDAGINLLLIFERTLHEALPSAQSFEDFYQSYLAAVKVAVDSVADGINRSRQDRARYNPLPMRTLLVDDCIDKGLDFNNKGARYRWSIINFAGLINVIDSLLAVRDLVFTEKAMSADALLAALAANDPSFLRRARAHCASFGSDDVDVDAFSGELSAAIFSTLDDKELVDGSGFIPASIQFMSQEMAGKPIGATPDGRTAGSPLCDSLAAIFGKDRKGPTALLKSVCALNLERLLGTPILNFNIQPDFDVNTLKALILGYQRLGGIQMQISCVSRETLLDAYAHPDLHENLIVRVGGYSEYFCRLSDALKRMIIDRTIQETENAL